MAKEPTMALLVAVAIQVHHPRAAVGHPVAVQEREVLGGQAAAGLPAAVLEWEALRAQGAAEHPVEVREPLEAAGR